MRTHLSTRLEVNLNEETADALVGLAERRGCSVTEIVRRSIAVLYFLQNEQDAGKQIQTVDQSGRVTAVEIR